MENINIKSMTDNFQKLTDLSFSAMRSSIESSTRNLSAANKVFSNMGMGNLSVPILGKQSENCCPPEKACPPHCLMEIDKKAYAGEVIVVPFMVKNTCNHKNNYRVGVRELKNIDGSIAPSQPILNKQLVTLEPGQSELVLMKVNLGNFPAGQNYTTEIVLREKDYNQNICFNLEVEGFGDAPVAEPQDEKNYRLKWQSWRSHFYCEPPLKRSEN